MLPVRKLNSQIHRVGPEFRRREIKFRIHEGRIAEFRELLLPFVKVDPHAARDSRGYDVRSLYLDTEDLRFYHEGMDGIRVRRKLRIRSYDHREGGAFLEIKRKRGNRTHKERLFLPSEELPAALRGDSEILSLNASEERTLDRFRFNLTSLQLTPAMVIEYEREAYVGIEDSRCRVTIDRDIRCGAPVAGEELAGSVPATTTSPIDVDHVVIEFKFDDEPPRWMAQIVGIAGLRRRSYSKYCHSVDYTRNRLP